MPRREDVWETLAGKDPMRAACTGGSRRLRWQADDFSATGDREVAWAVQVARSTPAY
jgi:hypothetical protein